jgi:hypothetical protein
MQRVVLDKGHWPEPDLRKSTRREDTLLSSIDQNNGIVQK